MSTLMEDRLTVALRARAELVQPEGLQHQTLSQPLRPPVRRRALVVSVAAAVVVAGVLTVVVNSRDSKDHPPADRIPKPVHSLSGDVDRDGRADRLRTSGTTLTLTRASDPDHPVSKQVPHLAGLIGLIDAGVYGRGIVVATGGTTVKGGRSWTVYILRGGGRLGTVSISAREMTHFGVLGVFEGRGVAWITADGTLMGGWLDPLQRGEQRLAVGVSRFVFQDQGSEETLQEKAQGRWCWDTASQSLPQPCPDGVTDAFDPGPHGSLPVLRPVADPDWIMNVGSGSDTWRDGTTRLRIVKGRPSGASTFEQDYDLVGVVDGRPVSVRIGKVGTRLFKTFVDLGHGVRGLVAADESEGAWNLLALTPRGLVPLSPAVSHSGLTLHPGTIGFRVDGKARAASTWIADGKVFTRVETDQVGRYDVYEWQVTDSSGAKLTPVDLGTVCIDDFQDTYGTCR